MFVSGIELGDGRLVFLRLYTNYAVARCGNHVSERDDVARSEPTLTLCTMNTENACLLMLLHSCTNSYIEFSQKVEVVKERLGIMNKATFWISFATH